ncbi:MAG: hypothetical protein M3Z48_01730 [Lactobacillus sp.]|nr:hypothetical protein [Lactobacillus sp.]
MKSNEWHTFSEASRRMNRNRNYVSNRYRTSPSYFDMTTIKEIAGIKLINDDGIKYLENKIKKMVAHLNSPVFRWLMLQSKELQQTTIG